MADAVGDMQDRVREVQRLAGETTGEAVSEGGEVRVVAAPGGGIVELDLRMSAFELSGLELGEIIVETLKAADAKVSESLSAAVSSIMGGVLPDDEPEGEQR